MEKTVKALVAIILVLIGMLLGIFVTIAVIQDSLKTIFLKNKIIQYQPLTGKLKATPEFTNSIYKDFSGIDPKWFTEDK